MSVIFNGIGALVATFRNEDAEVGDIVTITDQNTVKKAGFVDTFCGLVVSKNGGYVGVQIKGGMELRCYDENLSIGRHYIAVDNNNALRLEEGPNAVPAMVVETDLDAGKATIIL